MITYSIIKKSQLEGAKRLDAEYYQPEYLSFERVIKSGSYKLWRDIEGKFITGPFGSEFNVENYIADGKYRYIRGKDVKEFFLLDNDNVYIPETDFERLKKYSLTKGDILISVVGTLGDTAIVYQDNLPAIFSCKSTAFRTKAINPYYFLAYLNSKYGSGFLERSVRGTVQTGLNINDLKDLPVYIPSESEQNAVGMIVIQAKTELENSKSLYSQAENLLLEELGLKDFTEEQSLYSIVNFSKLKEANRMDAEYFVNRFKIQDLGFKNVKTLGELATLKKGVEVGAGAYQNKGKFFIRVSSVSKEGITDKDQKYLKDDLYQKLKKDYEPKVNEILLTKDASPGVAYAVKEPVDGIISGGVLRVKLKEDIETEYLALVINSLVGRLQVERDAGGSIIRHWKPEQVKNMLIPILPKAVQEKIADLVKRSHESRKRAKELLESAKRKVEEMIERKG